MTRYRILPYRAGSRSATALAARLGGRVLRLQGSTFRPRRGDIIINWGNTDTQRPHTLGHPATFLQLPNSVRNASNKLLFFNAMRDAQNSDIIPQFWTRRADIPDEAFQGDNMVVCRTVLAGHSGEGIVLARNRGDLVDAPLYVQYIKKQEEYRIHVGLRGDQSIIIARQRKARRRDVPDTRVNWQIRNHHNGFIFERGGVAPPRACEEAAQRALAAAGLIFGAVDVIWNERQSRAYVLEVNTAPGLEGQTVEDYAAFFEGFRTR